MWLMSLFLKRHHLLELLGLREMLVVSISISQ
jgi:hypothetical protein